MTVEQILGIVGLMVAILGIGIAVRLYFKLQHAKYDKEKGQAIMEDVRASFEKQMYGLNDRLMQNEERWRDVNHLLLRKEQSDINQITINSRPHHSDFLKVNGINENDLLLDESLIFVLTPFHPMWDNQFMTIRETCTGLGFTCKRGDEDYFQGDIFPQVLKLILKSRLIIAIIDGRNPNVLYELGVAQALDKNVILVSGEPEDLPLDIKSQRFLIYKDSEDLKAKLRVELDKLR